MSFKTVFTAGMLGVSLTMTAIPAAHSETLRVLEGSVSSALSVPMNRAVVVEADQPFAELSIANPGIADISTLSDRSIYVLGKAPGRTTLTLLGADGSLITNVDVQVTLDVAEFKERLQQILPGEKIEVRTANDGIVLSGTVSSTAKLDRALDLAERYAPNRVSNLMGVGGVQQVMLKVRFAEMQRSVSKQLSGSIGFFNPGGRFRAGAANNIAGVNNVLTGATVSTALTGAVGASFNIGGLEFGALLEALENKGMVRTLAEPNLSALSGQEAKFLAGGEVPIPVANTDNVITVEYKPFGVELAFTPRVVDGDTINLMINAAVSALDTTDVTTTNNITLPRGRDHGRDARRAEHRHRRAVAGRLHRPQCPGALAWRHSGAGRAFPQRRLPARAVGTGDHRHPAPDLADPRRGAGAADRPGPPAVGGRVLPARQDRGARQPAPGCRRRGCPAGLLGFLWLCDGVSQCRRM